MEKSNRWNSLKFCGFFFSCFVGFLFFWFVFFLPQHCCGWHCALIFILKTNKVALDLFILVFLIVNHVHGFYF